MDFELQFKLKSYRKRLYQHLFTDEEIDKWEKNEKVLISRKFAPLLQGDWTRSARFDGYQGMNLDSLINVKKTKTELFNIIKDEISRNIEFKNSDYYVHNFNPNLFFLLFDQFYGSSIKKTKIKFDAKTINDNIYGITFCNESKKVFREETLYLIELHSMFILNQNIQKTLGEELFAEIFIKNCQIQYYAKKHNPHSKNRYIDMSYLINKMPFLIEINEKYHSIILDYFKEIDVELSTGSKLNSLELYDETVSLEESFKVILKNFCTTLYKAEYKDEGVILYMVEFADFNVDTAKIGVQLVNNNLTLKLSEITSLPFFDENEETIDIDLLIIKLFNIDKINPNTDFNNWDEIIKNRPKKIKKKDLLLILTMEKNNIELNAKGIMKILTNIPTNLWSRQDDYFEYLQNLQEKYVKTVSHLLENKKKSNLIDRYIENKKIIELIKYDQNEYFNKLKEKIGNRTMHNLFHEKLPFLKATPNKGIFVDFNMYKNLVDQKFLDQLSNNHVKKVESCSLGNIELILGFTIMSSEEINDIYNMTKKQFNDKYYNSNNESIDFID